MAMELQMEQKTDAKEQPGATEVGHETVFVGQFTDGILDPNRPMLGPVRDGGT